MSEKDYVDNYEDMTSFTLTDEQEASLLEKQTECSFMWTNSMGRARPRPRPRPRHGPPPPPAPVTCPGKSSASESMTLTGWHTYALTIRWAYASEHLPTNKLKLWRVNN